jgi:signal transduction histidine kinase
MVDLVLAGRIVSLASGVGLLMMGWRMMARRDTPSTSSFAILLVVLGIAALCGGITSHTGTLYKLVWLATTLAIPMALAAFSFDYYGLTYFSSPGRLVVSLLPATAGLLGGSLVVLGTPMQSPGSTAPVALLSSLPAPVYDVAGTLGQVGLYYTAAVILLAVALVLRSVTRYRHLDTTLGPVLAFVGVWPWLIYVTFPELTGVFARESILLGVASGYAGSVLAAVLAVGPLGLFESTPAAGNVGPETVLDSMDDAVVVDSEEHVLRLNAVARETFDVTPADAVGGPLADVVGLSLSGLSTGETVALPTVDGQREFQVTRCGIAGRTGNSQGYALLFRDVTRRQTREQRLSVLNRVLRHNLRNDATSIIGRAELISDGGDPGDSAERIVETTHDLVDAAERAREIETMMTAASGTETTAVADALERVVADVGNAYPAVEFTTALPTDVTATVHPTVFETVLRNVVENAAEHNDAKEPIVVVSATTDDGELSLAVADNGPGIPDHERAIIGADEESDLKHGSGLGLWATYWGVTRMGGDLAFSENNPRGTVVTLTVPVEPQAA